ncbi:MAG: hypothetical protein CL402_00210 [Acidiferrobacteraceae bacterium]|nr:hypothetical protein [Acidiferrobacteraceae bacterium]|tara:strand:- start:362 stop:1174 length:813 start_codon:yes stop_codon:yes gene_type:complete
MKKLINKFTNLVQLENYLKKSYDLLLHREIAEKRSNHINPLNKFSVFSGFAQSDEDGITLEILRRIGLNFGYFVEFGVGDGTENNSLILLACNWKGAWFGGQELTFDTSCSDKLNFEKVWISKDNILSLYNSLNESADVISLDLDGNDIYLVEELLSNKVQPKLFIVEYNAKFPPPIEFKIDYNPTHTWVGDDYFGASLKSFNNLFSSYGYRLVCCNLSGANAFFVASEYAHLFDDVPKDIEDIYCEPFYFLRSKRMHPTSIKTISKLIR